MHLLFLRFFVLMTTSDKMSSLIKIRDLRHSYKEGESIKEVLHGINLDFYEGQIVIIVGPSGSGKTTLLKLIGAQLSIQEGQIEIQGEKLQGASQAQLRKIRRKIGFIFQSHHLLDSINVLQNVQLPLAFDENHNAKSSAKLAMESLEKVSIANQAHKNPSHLSGGQKQRVAIAGVLAMRPKCILLDEPTAMLDPSGRREVLSTLEELRKKEKITVVLITHYMEEVTKADKIYVMDKGKVVLEGTPLEVFKEVEFLKSLGLDVPQVTLLAHQLKKQGINLPEVVLEKEELVNLLCAEL